MVLPRWIGPARDYVSVYQAGSEAEALLVVEILAQAGIPAAARSRQVPGYGEVIRRASGVWGDVLVPAGREEEARRSLAEYLRVMEEGGR
ncbi:MAG: DUF2007 domain-containing protein [Armatimonadota bacterium]|nr:DUF2007 domain-containing protein [Armatimonadota bacterium]MDR7401798.1 DUF2007 domain-containing protein [Armatimonadota bacterium]MDR7403100.1 DUF2007 domain-containing protein [Armatimonadota bacterium]MDR7436197.1 DUF2007 domain-containing protein [Armatimonadota bacterium]MDR7471422.1 DUF2007 domain-containing protein [Armatimonadota bacterium]